VCVFSAKGAASTRAWGSAPQGFVKPKTPALKARFTFGANSIIIHAMPQSVSKVILHVIFSTKIHLWSSPRLDTARRLQRPFRRARRSRPTNHHHGLGRGWGVGRTRGIGLGLGVGVGRGVEVGVAVAVGVGVGVAVAVGVGVGVPPASNPDTVIV